MSVLAASLHGRILRAFVLIVVLAVVLAVGVGYYVTQRQMDGFVAQLIAVEAGNVARSLSRAYGSAGGWATVDQVLADAGYRYAEEEEGHEGSGEHDEHGAETFHVERVRIVVVDGDRQGDPRQPVPATTGSCGAGAGRRARRRDRRGDRPPGR